MQKRVEVFLEMLQVEEIDKVSVDADQADGLLHLLDAVVIKLEGGTEEDLQVLDIKPSNPIMHKDTIKEKEEVKSSKAAIEKKVEASDANKTDEAPRAEKTFKNGQGVDAEIKSVEKDENLTEETEKPEETGEIKKEDNIDEPSNHFTIKYEVSLDIHRLKFFLLRHR